MCYVSDILVGDGDVHEDFSNDVIKVGHAIDFLYEVGEVSEQFMKILVGGNGVARVQPLGFDFRDLLGQLPRLVEVLLHVRLILLHEHLVALRSACELLHVLRPFLRVLSLRHKRTELALGLLAPLGQDATHLGDVAGVSLLGGDRVTIQEIVQGVEYHLRAGGFAVHRTNLFRGVATEIILALGDARGHELAATPANHELPHERGLGVRAWVDNLFEVDAHLLTVVLEQTLEILDGDGGREIVLLKQVDVLAAKLHRPDVEGVVKDVRDELVVDDERAVLRVLRRDGIPTLAQMRRDVLLGRAFKT